MAQQSSRLNRLLTLLDSILLLFFYFFIFLSLIIALMILNYWICSIIAQLLVPTVLNLCLRQCIVKWVIENKFSLTKILISWLNASNQVYSRAADWGDC